MKYFGTITGLPAAATPAATPGALPLPAEEEPAKKPDYRRLALLCVAGFVIVAGVAYLVGRRR